MWYESRVIAGKGRGRGLGFPTLNLEIPKNFDIQEGIYACAVTINEKKYKGALHFGPIPTFDDLKQSLEIFVLDYDGATPALVSFALVRYLRPILNFNTPDALKKQIAEDVAEINNQ